jgi:hypothetical protein
MPAGDSARSAIGQPFVPWERLAGTLDPPIEPLVAAINRTGWALTVFSCAGHPEEPDSVARQRRQAHVDVVVSDEQRWRRFVDATRRRAPHGVRVTEGPLGDVPAWLAPHLPPRTTWRYRRLVLEPRPYDGPDPAMRLALDQALAAAVAALNTST